MLVMALAYLALPCRGLDMPCLALLWHVVALACLALPCLALPCLSMAYRGFGFACRAFPWHCSPFKTFRESEAIGCLGWRGLP